MEREGKGCGEGERITLAAMMDGAMGWELRYYGRGWMNGDSMSKFVVEVGVGVVAVVVD